MILEQEHKEKWASKEDKKLREVRRDSHHLLKIETTNKDKK